MSFDGWAVFLNLCSFVPNTLYQACVGFWFAFEVKLFWQVFHNPLVSSTVQALALLLVL
jgi:hypothetical protein